eukprot:jgi/Bigna1/88968/estExt_fgenesh1_pg.C_410088
MDVATGKNGDRYTPLQRDSGKSGKNSSDNAPSKPVSTAQFQEETWNPIIAILSYMASSAGTSCFQKLAITAFKRPLLLLAVQTTFGAFFLAIYGIFYKRIHLGGLRDFLRYSPVSVCFTGKVVFSMVAYDYCTLGTYVVISSTCPLFSLPIEAVFFKENKFKVTRHTVGSILVIVCGVGMYGMRAETKQFEYSDHYSEAKQARWAGDRDHSGRSQDVDQRCLPDEAAISYGVVVFAFPFGEYRGFTTMLDNLRDRDWIFIVLSCFLTYAIGYLSLKCQRVVSATSFHIIGSICKAAVVLFGLLVLNEKYNSYSALACIMTLLGGLWYSWAITNANASAAAAAAVAEKEGELIEVSGEGMYQSVGRRRSTGSRNDETTQQPLLPTQHVDDVSGLAPADANGVR